MMTACFPSSGFFVEMLVALGLSLGFELGVLGDLELTGDSEGEGACELSSSLGVVEGEALLVFSDGVADAVGELDAEALTLGFGFDWLLTGSLSLAFDSELTSATMISATRTILAAIFRILFGFFVCFERLIFPAFIDAPWTSTPL
jgi:hypothetical protein